VQYDIVNADELDISTLADQMHFQGFVMELSRHKTFQKVTLEIDYNPKRSIVQVLTSNNRQDD